MAALAVVTLAVSSWGVGGSPGSWNALDPEAETGQVLWSFASGASVAAGASIADHKVFWSSGYSSFGSGNNKFYAFSVDER